ncbi:MULTISPECIES: ABC transporter ATP-binding protein [Streptomyces]|uniref:ABC transporter ATP-binding protein n=1 Tax=Streptomyces evansiae TaxID=3075535 RepID=A0ABU2R5F1_9ACTN|nr:MULTISPECIES: ABC transporter ATP-binding protein [unclassified Streptomyces]EFL03956.1 D-methionine ABC transporter, ATP-binding protein [Streptomyces sp. SPB78]MDT0411865.1 ABC transporter ATP-binding protein [Streptomyces sp. DSM 41979]MYQ55921.1 ATP-binding cassette domain-containing protein [Streptomyces sp. SID4926]SCE57320.1 peptide/nickel transport system ATP-binding protein [Streptomyces sp. DfronAA-171]
MSAATTTPVPSAPSGEAVLSVRDLSVSFRGHDRTVHAVDGLSYDVAPGEVLAVVGESGCGKSVTSMAVMGLLPPTAHVTGSVRLAGRELVGLSEKRLARLRGQEMAMIFQEPMTSLNPVLTVGRQIGEVLRKHQGLGRREARERAIELLTLVGIPAPAKRVDEYPHQLSGGMRQRVMIAIAVACDPAVLIADEPTTALDVTVQAGILDVLRNLRERLGTAIVLITHDLGVVADTADRVLVMYAGRAVEQAEVAELYGRPAHPYTRGLLGAVLRPGLRGTDGRARLNEIPGMVPGLDAQPDACTFAPRCALADDTCAGARPALRLIDGAHRLACHHPAQAGPQIPEGAAR